ncbi:MAG: LuxR C-terminal-related transcriptional regulator [Peptococcaceae bacterium]|nr:LuxR C-terminal-related transcriptional regulator [Peptococcaceae bacterium]
MGYGKTLAVNDFVRVSRIPTLWMQFSEFDNVGLSFWEGYTRAVEQINKPLAEECKDLGFPDNEDKLNQYIFHRDRLMTDQRYLIVLDDTHLIKDTSVTSFIEHIIYNSPANRTLVMICREQPKLNLSGLLVRGMISNIDEKDLSFTENEVTQYLLQQGLSAEVRSLPEIYKDTEGWAFILNFLVRILKKTPGYTKYVRNFMKQSIFQLMEREAWNVMSERLQRFMTRLSLVNRITSDLVVLLAEGDESLVAEFDQQRVVYIRFEDNTGRYLIHHMFQDFLHSKHHILSEGEIHDTYKTAAEWCLHNGFNIDALTYYEKIGDYKSLVHIILKSPSQLLLSVDKHLKGIFDRASAEIFDRVEFFACAHVRILILAGLWTEALELLKYYEQKFLQLPTEDNSRGRTMGVLYYLWGVLRQLMCTVDDIYDFDTYFQKMSDCPMTLPIVQIRESFPLGQWINRVGTSRQNAPQEYLEALERSVKHMAMRTNNWMEGQDDLCQGELLFHQGEINAAKALFTSALERAEKGRQFALMHLALYYTLRIAAGQGNYEKAEQVLKDMEVTLEENDYYNRFSTYDITLGLYYNILRQTDRIPGWLKGKFAPYSPTNFLEISGNWIKARYFYLTKNYAVLLAFMEEWKRWEINLFGRIELLAMEACIHYQMKDKQRAYFVLHEAYATASPNNIVMPFIEMGKDMRTLTLTALRDPNCPVPEPWLKSINKKSSAYARQQSALISAYKKANDISVGVSLTHRETEVLHDLYKGYSRSEIAANQNLSMNTVRLIVNTIYEKLQARNIADLIRIVHEQKLM